MFLARMYILQEGGVPLLANFHYKTMNNFIKSVFSAYPQLEILKYINGNKLNPKYEWLLNINPFGKLKISVCINLAL